MVAFVTIGHDPDIRVWTNPKANYSQAGGKIEFRWHKGAFVRDEDLPPNQAAEVAANMKAASVNAKFLQCLAKTKAEKRAVSVARSASNYAPTIFAAMTTGKGVTKRDYADAMERLLHLGTIANDQPIYKRENRQWVRGLGLVEDAPTLAPTPAPTDAQTCTDHTVKTAENGDLDCTNLHALAPYISKDIEGAPLGVGPPSKDDIQRDSGEGDDD